MTLEVLRYVCDLRICVFGNIIGRADHFWGAEDIDCADGSSCG
jgi:hypothetical protein